MMIRIATLIAGALLSGGAAAPSDGLEGEWRNTKDTVHLKVEPCGAALCGTVTWAAPKQREDAKKGTGKDLVGSRLLTGLKRGGDGDWRGKVFVPDINTNASATVKQLSQVQILITGCTMLGLVCKSQHWHRIS
ncbi:DUF2147 domain-containing protein [Sphingomonas sp.]|uniref:DUF2147 domain-containing protein n=1 Tax=Sphingomonas sp. TaxID=28214 RepID=UPI001B1D6C45|nr:DUF2147 domain-containing protein [Sphingomonas sp.]MBO9713080.1 DUF2147 domain-containing protein [Sphingomonas sp.]